MPHRVRVRAHYRSSPHKKASPGCPSVILSLVALLVIVGLLVLHYVI